MIKFNHDADKIEEAISGYDPEEAMDIYEQIVDDPSSVLGNTQSTIVEALHENADDPNFLFAIGYFVQQGVGSVMAHNLMEEMLDERFKDEEGSEETQ